jgi:hypothetical protein
MAVGTVIIKQNSEITEQRVKINTLESQLRDVSLQYRDINGSVTAQFKEINGKLTDILIILQNKVDKK